MMQYTTIPYVKNKVSRILFGTAMMPFLEGGDGDALLDEMFALGINTFDTARNYNLAEKSLGSWLEKREIRDQVTILSKCGHHDSDGTKRVNETEMRADFAKSAEYLKTDYIDIYLLHRDDPEVPAGEVIEIFNAMHAEGKIGAFGGSNWTHARIAEANEYAYKHGLIPFTVSSPNFGLAEQVNDPWGGGCVSISGPQNAQARAWYEMNQMPVIAYSSLGRGMFSGKVKSSDRDRADQILDPFGVKGYVSEANFERLRRCEELAQKKGCQVAQIAMAWMFGQKVKTFAVVSTSSAARMQSNMEALEIKLSEEELLWLDLR